MVCAMKIMDKDVGLSQNTQLFNNLDFNIDEEDFGEDCDEAEESSDVNSDNSVENSDRDSDQGADEDAEVFAKFIESATKEARSAEREAEILEIVSQITLTEDNQENICPIRCAAHTLQLAVLDVQNFLDKKQISIATDHLRKVGKQIIQNSVRISQAPESLLDQTETINVVILTEIEKLLSYKETISQSVSASQKTINNRFSSLSTEIDNYLPERERIDTDILKKWYSNKSISKDFWELAKVILAAPATQVMEKVNSPGRSLDYPSSNASMRPKAHYCFMNRLCHRTPSPAITRMDTPNFTPRSC
ncbi:hypothetical protein BB558_003142 [Smittium angustum]|uniref:HAT C-terminal dimerisation domain-containing protein n=1 Tax=Smittium angustum TaxID=133377 RepID=A0A2U1J6W9_SMIAN|nr:hypothetical protein BB558_003142 [Smittium angustum]